VEIPEYNFVTGKREYNGKKLKLTGDTVLIIEGIHALNPLLTKKLPDSTEIQDLYLGPDQHLARRPQLGSRTRQPTCCAASYAIITKEPTRPSRPSPSGRTCCRQKTSGYSLIRRQPT
jgi:Uridine kinase